MSQAGDYRLKKDQMACTWHPHACLYDKWISGRRFFVNATDNPVTYITRCARYLTCGPCFWNRMRSYGASISWHTKDD